jgi:SsrA-binding protein
MKILAKNKRAYHEYIVTDKLEVGVALKGTEVKSIRESRFNFKDAYVRFKDREAWIIGFHISVYENSGYAIHKPDEERKLLMHKMEIIKWQKKVEQQGFTVVPLMIYLNNGRVKFEIGLCKGKKIHDKRHTLRDKDLNREMDRSTKIKL